MQTTQCKTFPVTFSKADLPRGYVRKFTLHYIYTYLIPSASDRKKVFADLMEILAVSQGRMYDIMRIRQGDTGDISSEQLSLLAEYFGLSMEDIRT